MCIRDSHNTIIGIQEEDHQEYLILSLQEADHPVLKAFGIDPEKNVTIHEIQYI